MKTNSIRTQFSLNISRLCDPKKFETQKIYTQTHTPKITFPLKSFLAPGAYMPVILDHVPTYVYPKSVIIQPKGYIKYV